VDEMGLPRALLLKRLRNELTMLSEELWLPVPEIPSEAKFPLEIRFTVKGTKGYSAPGVKAEEQAFTLILGDDFPYERPKVRWESAIFHPNIMSPDEGGLVCVMALDHWTFDSDLLSFVCALTDLINNPNPHDPLRTPTCAKAAEWFLGNM
jgi:ubiquitin-conjugating enzyme E2 C